MEDAARFPDVMLLAAGLGTRLLPLTSGRPKPLTEVGGTTLIDRVIAAARFEGARRFAVNAHHLADQMVAHFSGHPDFSVQREPELLGTGGGLRNGLSVLETDPVLVMNTDSFWPVGRDKPLARLVAKRAETGAGAVLLCAHPARAHGFSRSHDFCLDPGGRITDDFGLPVIYAGVALVARDLFADEDNGAFSINRLFERAREREALSGVLLDAPWFHVGDAAGLAEAEAALR